MVALAVLILTGTTSQTHAAFYKCIGEDGSTTYNDTPCAANESTHLLTKSARNVAALDCRIAHNFAFDAVARMRQDDSALDVFEAYGGADNISSEARNLINFVYSFKDKELVSSQRIVDSTVNRCRTGLLGKTLNQCGTFPKQFVARLGGCVEARQSDQTMLIQRLSEEEDELSRNTTITGPGLPEPTLQAANPVFQHGETHNAIPDVGIRRRLEIFQQRALTK